MWVGMGIVTGNKNPFVLGIMGRVRIRVSHGMDPVISFIALLVLSGLRPGMGFRVTGVNFRFVSR